MTTPTAGRVNGPAPGADIVLNVQRLSKRYGQVRAVDDISFEVYRGETFGILGPNGAGKTTTLEIIEGLRSADAGAIRFLGVDALRERHWVRERIGVQLQSQALWPELTVEETLKLFRSLFRVRVAVEPLLERFSLVDKRGTLVKGLSGGQKQRLSVATALVNDPEVVFLDEPTTGLDPQARHTFWDLVREMRHEGKTVIVTTHYMEEAEALCERVAIMDHGLIIALDTPRELVRSLGSGSTIECGFEHGVDERLLTAAPGVRDIRSEDGRFLLFTSDAPLTLQAVVQLAQKEACAIHSLNVRSASLEDVFIVLTGRKLRD